MFVPDGENAKTEGQGVEENPRLRQKKKNGKRKIENGKWKKSKEWKKWKKCEKCEKSLDLFW